MRRTCSIFLFTYIELTRKGFELSCKVLELAAGYGVQKAENQTLNTNKAEIQALNTHKADNQALNTHKAENQVLNTYKAENQALNTPKVGTRYFFPGSLIAKSLFFTHGLLSQNRYFLGFQGSLNR